jgi:hypothetical protein
MTHSDVTEAFIAFKAPAAAGLHDEAPVTTVSTAAGTFTFTGPMTLNKYWIGLSVRLPNGRERSARSIRSPLRKESEQDAVSEIKDYLVAWADKQCEAAA